MAKQNKTVDRIQAVWNKLGGENGIDRLLKGELSVVKTPHPWRREGNIVYFTVVGEGVTGEEWINWFDDQNIPFEKKGMGRQKEILLSPDFIPTVGKVEIAVLDSQTCGISKNGYLFTRQVRQYAESRGYKRPNPDIACYIRKLFTDADFYQTGFREILPMHDPIRLPAGTSHFLTSKIDYAGWSLHPHNIRIWHGDDGGISDTEDKHYRRWSRDCGFAYIVPE